MKSVIDIATEVYSRSVTHLTDGGKKKITLTKTSMLVLSEVVETAETFAKQFQNDLGLTTIELNHTKQLLESCEKALEEREAKFEKLKQALHGIYNVADADNPSHEHIFTILNEVI